MKTIQFSNQATPRQVEVSPTKDCKQSRTGSIHVRPMGTTDVTDCEEKALREAGVSFLVLQGGPSLKEKSKPEVAPEAPVSSESDESGTPSSETVAGPLGPDAAEESGDSNKRNAPKAKKGSK